MGEPGPAPSGEGARQPSTKDVGHARAAERVLTGAPLPDTTTPATLRTEAVKAVVAEQQTEPAPTPEPAPFAQPEQHDRAQEADLTNGRDEPIEEPADADRVDPAAEAKEHNEALIAHITPGVARLLGGEYSVDAQKFADGETLPHPDLDLNVQRTAEHVNDFVLGLTVNVSPQIYENRQANVHEKTLASLEQAANEDNPETIDTLAAVGLLDADTPDEDPVPTPDTFFNRYFYNTGDFAQLAQDLQAGLADENGVVPFDRLNKRLAIIAPYLKRALSKEDYDVGSELVRDLAYAHAALQSPERDLVAETVQNRLQEPVDDPEVTTYLNKLAEQTQAEFQATETSPGFTIRTGEAFTNAAAKERGEHEQSETRTWLDAAKGIGVICEGQNGNPHGGKASAMVVNSLMRSFNNPPEHKDAEAAKAWLVQQVIKASKFLEAYKGDYYTPEGTKIKDSAVPKNASTTLNIVYIANGNVITINLGNSRAAWQVDGQDMQNLTVDHTAARKKLERHLGIGPFKRVPGKDGADRPIIQDKARSEDHVMRIQDVLDQVQNPRDPDHPNTATMTGEEELLWRVRADDEHVTKLTGKEPDLASLLDVRVVALPQDKPVRIFGLSSELTRLFTRDQISRALSGKDPQSQAENLIATLEQSGEATPRGERNRSRDAGVIVMDLAPAGASATTEPEELPDEVDAGGTRLVQTRNPLTDEIITEERPERTFDELQTVKNGT